MKKVLTQSALLLAFSMVFISCSVERNSVSRGGESGYGIGSGIASNGKNKSLKSMSAEEAVITAGPSQNASEEIVSPELQHKAFNNAVVGADAAAVIPASAKNFDVVASQKSAQNLAEKVIKKSPATPAAASRGSKSWITALLLCWFLGTLGIHRLYLGYSNWWLMLITFGGLGIWALIDLIRIIMKDMQPYRGRYAK